MDRADNQDGMKQRQRILGTIENGRAIGTWIACYMTLLHCFSSLSLSAHPISLSTVVANIETNRVKVEMKILVEDLVLFQGLQPDNEQVLSAEDLREASKAHHQFLLDYFQVRLLDGRPLSGKVTSTDTEEVPEEGVKADEVMATSVYYELEYSLPETPSFLTFSQNFGGDANPLPSVMDLIILQNSARLGYPVQISPKNPHSVELDWVNPPTNDRRSWRQRRELMRERRETLLGITSYSTTYSFIYITESEIRHEILVPLLTLETWFPIERADADFLEVAEQDKAAEAVADYFRDKGAIFIDGVKVPAHVDRVDFYGLDFRDFAQRAEKKRVVIHNARAGIILSYGAKTPPTKVSVTWDTFNDFTPLLNSVVYEFRKPGYRHFFTPAEPTFLWQTEEPSLAIEAAQSIPAPVTQAIHRLPILSATLALVGVLTFFVAGVRRNLPCFLIGLTAFALAGGLLSQGVGPTIPIPRSVPPDQVISEADAQAVFAGLHANLYRAFDYRDEGTIYDVLAESVHGDLLDTLYLQIRNGLRIEEQGGAIARVDSVSIEDGKLLERVYRQGQPLFRYQCTWKVAGTVEHWGHIHTRENQYQAEFKVEGQDKSWKIADLKVLNESRIAFKTGLRETN